MSHPSLSQLQTWFQAVLSSPMPMAQAVAAARDSCGLDPRVLQPPSEDESALPGLAIYARGYWLRLLECMEAEYPAVAKTLGDELFGFFARAYLQYHPSASPTLHDLGAGFAEFLESTQPRQMAAEDNAGFRLVLDLARLERARAEVVRAKGIEGEAASSAPDPLAYLKGDGVTARLVPCVRLLLLGFPLIGYLHAIDQEQEPPALPDAKPTVLAISRMHYRVQMVELEPWQAAFLESVPGSSSLHECVRTCTAAMAQSSNAILPKLFKWLPVAISKGLVQIS